MCIYIDSRTKKTWITTSAGATSRGVLHRRFCGIDEMPRLMVEESSLRCAAMAETAMEFILRENDLCGEFVGICGQNFFFV